MHLLQNLPAFLAATYLLAIVPGQGMAMVFRQSLLGGPKAAFWSVLGNSTGLVVWGTLSAVGLSVIFRDSPTAYAILKWCGVAFLVYLSVQTAFQMRKASGKFDLSGEVTRISAASAYRTGLFTNLTNVKAAVFAVAFLPVYVPHEVSLGAGVAFLGAVWALVSMSWYALLILAVKRASALLEQPRVRRILTGVSAVGLLALAAGLALS